MSLTYEFIKTQTGLKVKFKTEEQLYALYDLLTAHLPPRAEPEPEPVTKPKIKKAKKATSAILEPVDADTSVSVPAVALGATDSLRDNKYRLQVLNPELCLARKIDKENPVPGTRPGDIGAKLKFYPELQCSKRPVTGSSLCTICARKEAEYLCDTSGVHGWFGRLDEPLFEKAGVVGCHAFWAKYPAGVAEATLPVATATASTAVATAAEKPKKVKKAKVAPAAPVASQEPAAAIASQEPEKPKKVKKVKVAAQEPIAEPESEPIAAAQEPEKPKKVKKAKVATAPAATEEPAVAIEEPTAAIASQEPVAAQEPEKPKKVKKAKVAVASEEPVDAIAPIAPIAAQEPEKPKKAKKAVATNAAATAVEWITFLHEGIPLIRHTKSNNCYQCDRSKHRIEEMVMRDKFEGKWRDGRLDPYAEEDEE